MKQQLNLYKRKWVVICYLQTSLIRVLIRSETFVACPQSVLEHIEDWLLPWDQSTGATSWSQAGSRAGWWAALALSSRHLPRARSRLE